MTACLYRARSPPQLIFETDPQLDFAHFPVTLGWLKTGRMAPRAVPALHIRTSAGGCRKNLSMSRNHADIEKFRFPLVEPPNTWKSPTANVQSRAEMNPVFDGLRVFWSDLASLLLPAAAVSAHASRVRRHSGSAADPSEPSRPHDVGWEYFSCKGGKAARGTDIARAPQHVLCGIAAQPPSRRDASYQLHINLARNVSPSGGREHQKPWD